MGKELRMECLNCKDLIIAKKDLFKSKKHQIDYTYSKDECRALKEKLQLDDLLNLIVCGSIVLNDNQNYNLSARIKASIVQTCIVSLTPVKTNLNFKIERHYSTKQSAPNKKTVIPDIFTKDVEYLGDNLSIEEVISEAMLLEIPTYPRRKNVKFKGISVTKNGLKPLKKFPNNPFSSLKDLIS